MKKKIKIISIVSIILFLLVLPLFNTGLANEEKEYRSGEVVNIGGIDYIFAANTDSLEILESDSEGELKQVSEIYLKGVVSVASYTKNGSTYVFASTGGNIYKINATNPSAPTIEINRNVYEWRSSRTRIGYVRILAVNDNFLFVGSRDGVKAMGLDNLIVEKEYTRYEAYGLAANNEKLVVITKAVNQNKAIVFNVDTTDEEAEYKLKNKDGIRRNPSIDSAGNIYLPSDNSLIKVNKYGDIVSQYKNPTASGVVHSYSVHALDNGDVYYVNGYGVTSLDDDLKKESFFFAANSYDYGPNSWAVNVSASRNKVAVFNRSSVILLNTDLDILSSYTYTPKYNSLVFSDLKMTLNKYSGGIGENIHVGLYGFWPNEDVKLELGKKTYNTKPNRMTVVMNKLGANSASIKVPEVASKSGVTTLKAVGVDSGLRYETTFKVQ